MANRRSISSHRSHVIEVVTEQANVFGLCLGGNGGTEAAVMEAALKEPLEVVVRLVDDLFEQEVNATKTADAFEHASDRQHLAERRLALSVISAIPAAALNANDTRPHSTPSRDS